MYRKHRQDLVYTNVLHGVDDGVNSSNQHGSELPNDNTNADDDSARLGDDRTDTSSMAMTTKEELTRSAALFMLKTMEVHKTSQVWEHDYDDNYILI